MMLPNMSRAVRRWAKKLEVINQVISTIDFEPTETITSRTVHATVQPAQKRRLNPDIINWSLKYVFIHSDPKVELGEFFSHLGIVYKIIDDGDFSRYGFTDALGEEVKNCHIKHDWKNP